MKVVTGGGGLIMYSLHKHLVLMMLAGAAHRGEGGGDGHGGCWGTAVGPSSPQDAGAVWSHHRQGETSAVAASMRSSVGC